MRIAHDVVSVQVPATSANLGPGFDSLGLALSLVDDLKLEATTGGCEITVRGEGAGSLPTGEDHLVVKALRMALDHVGAPQIGIRLRAFNRIPHGRGLGSSAAAAVAGLMLARGLISDPEALDGATMLRLATELEGHPDNAAPAIFGGVTVAWVSTRRGATPLAAPLAVRDPGALRPVVLVPGTTLSTDRARFALPSQVTHRDAAFNAGRSALLVHAVTTDPELLLAATEDRLHQHQRAGVMPESVQLLDELRREGIPAVISGAGPSVLVFRTSRAQIVPIVRAVVADPSSWRLAEFEVRTQPTAPVVV